MPAVAWRRVMGTRRAPGDGMNAIFFGLKRAHWGFVNRSRRWLVRWPHLTAARFDLLYALRGYRGLTVFQKHLRKKLGVCRPVLTRMLKSLVALGWVTRTRSTIDRRTYEICITAEGGKIIEAAYRRWVNSGRAMRWAHRALAGKYGARDRERSFRRMEWFEDVLQNMREVFRAGGWVSYPWHPDD